MDIDRSVVGEVLLSTREVAELLGVSSQRVSEFVKEGRLVPVTFSYPTLSRWFKPEEVARFAAIPRPQGKRGPAQRPKGGRSTDGSGRGWTREEDEYILAHMSDLARDIGNRLNRTAYAVRARRSQLRRGLVGPTQEGVKP